MWIFQILHQVYQLSFLSILNLFKPPMIVKNIFGNANTLYNKLNYVMDIFNSS